ncbi:MAG: TetR/AcrR family transcriptional regulator [Tomitella sp.]|nr:TetR/AcrR family transcriptional regulator [Tomitella sp.]
MLDVSARQFRMHGFADTSTEQLCAASGLGRSSLYNTFTSKEELFRRSLEQHLTDSLDQHEAVLTDNGLSGLARLQALLDIVVDEETEARNEGHAAGCMIVASRMTPDLGVREPRVQMALDRFQDRQLSLLTEAVMAGRADGSIDKDLNVRDAANMVVSAISGIRVLSQSGTKPENLRRIATLHLTTLAA